MYTLPSLTISTTYFYVIILFYFRTHIVATQNIVCNGGFDNFTFIEIGNGEGYCFAASNTSCWFNQNSSSIYEVKRKKNPPVGNIAELFSDRNYTLCQYLSLQLNQQYQINFDIVNSIQMNWSIIYVKLNSIHIYNKKTLNAYNTSKGSCTFTANVSVSKLCFTSNFAKTITPTSEFEGPGVDNITVIKVITNSSILSNSSNASTPNKTNTTIDTTTNTSNNTNTSINISIIINTTSDRNTSTRTLNENSTNSTNTATINQSNILNDIINENKGKKIIIPVYCTTLCSDDYFRIDFGCRFDQKDGKSYLQELSKALSFLIYFENQLQNFYQVTVLTQNQFLLTVHPMRTYDLSQITIGISQNPSLAALSEIFTVLFYLDNVQITFIYLPKKQVQMLNSVQPLARGAMKITKDVYSVLRVTFFSYFLMNIISFWNLSLMYFFVNIPTVPVFSKQFMQKLIYEFYSLSSIIGWFQKKFPQMEAILNVTNSIEKEKMEKFKFHFAWFRVFGLSSGYLINNLETFFLMAVMVIKLLLIFLIRRYFKDKITAIKNFLPRRAYLFQIFLKEFICFSIFMTVSSSTCILNPGVEGKKQKINNSIQIFSLWITIMTIPLFYLNSVRFQNRKIFLKRQQIRQLAIQNRRKDEQEQEQKQEDYRLIIKQITKLKQKIKYVNKTSLNQLLDYLHYITIPFLVIIKNADLFIISCTITITLRCWFYQKYAKHLNFTKLDKFFLFFNLLVWFVHHYTYVLMWVFAKIIKNSENINKTKIYDITNICGLIILFTVLVGGILQQIKTCIQLLFLIYQIIKKLFLKCKKLTKQNKKQITRKKNTPLQANINNKKQKDLTKIQNNFNFGKVSSKFLNYLKDSVIKKQKQRGEKSIKQSKTQYTNSSKQKSKKSIKSSNKMSQGSTHNKNLIKIIMYQSNKNKQIEPDNIKQEQKTKVITQQ